MNRDDETRADAPRENALRTMLVRHEELQEARAQEVFELLMNRPAKPSRRGSSLLQDPSYAKWAVHADRWAKHLKALIKTNLDHESIWQFIELASHSDVRAAIELGKQYQADIATARARASAEALHNKPGGSRSKRAAIQAIWATGKYSSRDLCAEQECAALEMSFATARKALRNTPDPA